jgi:POT family proton-dependent oligopeptide transporter
VNDLPPQAAAAPQMRRWFGFPKGAWLIIGVEFWERFSFYGMLSILALFLTASPSRGGFGWSTAESLSLLGAYTFAMYAFPAVGGYIADRIIGRRRAVAIGATFMLVGQILLSSPVFFPEILGWLHGAPLLRALRGLGVPLGRWVGSSAIAAAISGQGPSLDAHAGTTWLAQAYAACSLGFYAAILCLIVGNALMKSTLVVLCGETMDPSDPRREAAFAYYYLGISVGAMLSGFAVGIVAQTFGWHFGFMVAAGGMAIALGFYLAFSKRWLGAIGAPPDRTTFRGRSVAAGSASRVQARTPGEASRRVTLLFVLALLLCAFSIGWFQLFGSWLLFIDGHVDRTVAGFAMPVPWFTSINAAIVILLAPLIAALWVRLAERNRALDIVQKYIFALAMVSLANGLFYLAARQAISPAQASVWLPLAALALIAAGELVAWTGTYGMVSRSAPVGFASVTMGFWYLLTLGLGGYLSGFTGHLVDSFGFATAFLTITGFTGGVFVLAIFLRAPLARLAARAGVPL